jgi:hypothetical protein
MHLEAANMDVIGQAALVAGHHPHHGRLADNDLAGPWQAALHGLDEIDNGCTANLLVKRQGELQRALERQLCRARHCHQRQRVKPLHVAGAAAEKLPITFGEGPGIGGPGLTVDRHHVGVSREDDTTIGFRSDLGVKMRLHTARTCHPFGTDTVARSR